MARRRVGLSALLAAIAGLVAVGLASWVAQLLKKPGVSQDILTAGGLLWAAGLPALVLAVVLTGKVRGGASLGFVAGIAIRMPAGGVLALYGLHWNLSATPAFTQIVAFSYLVLLIIEVMCLVPAVKFAAAATPPVPDPSSGLHPADDTDPTPAKNSQESA